MNNKISNNMEGYKVNKFIILVKSFIYTTQNTI